MGRSRFRVSGRVTQPPGYAAVPESEHRDWIRECRPDRDRDGPEAHPAGAEVQLAGGVAGSPGRGPVGPKASALTGSGAAHAAVEDRRHNGPSSQSWQDPHRRASPSARNETRVPSDGVLQLSFSHKQQVAEKQFCGPFDAALDRGQQGRGISARFCCTGPVRRRASRRRRSPRRSPTRISSRCGRA